MKFEEGYFKDSTTSNYRDYTQKKYGSLCDDLIALGIRPEHRIVDFGCATGILLHEFSARGYGRLTGTDISWWAIQEGRRRYGFGWEILQHLNYSLLESGADWVLALDVFEHIGQEELSHILGIIKCGHVIVRVPVSAREGEPYVLPVSRNDKTHIQCHTKMWWIDIMKWHGIHYLGDKCGGRIMGRAIYDSDGVMAGVFKCER